MRGTRDLLVIEDEGHHVIHFMHTLNLSQVALQQRRCISMVAAPTAVCKGDPLMTARQPCSGGACKVQQILHSLCEAR